MTGRVAIQTGVRLDEAMKIAKMAEQQGVSIYTLMQKLIREKLAEQETGEKGVAA